ncbi:hypothetical protein [Paremcibacter congregatus]|uniref:hypothetical protein n=1 Tax=Paremcibacter congregatus TaxID=2043170 RepID=UPI003A94F715
MTTTTEILKWREYHIELRYDPDPYHQAARNGVAIAHLEIRCLRLARAALPISETGYRSVFMPDCDLKDYDSAADYVRQWLECAAQTRAWQDRFDQARQLSLF